MHLHIHHRLTKSSGKNLPQPRDAKLRSQWYGALRWFSCLMLVLFFVACKHNEPGGGEGENVLKPPPNSLELVFVYGSEKEKWITEVTERI